MSLLKRKVLYSLDINGGGLKDQYSWYRRSAQFERVLCMHPNYCWECNLWSYIGVCKAGKEIEIICIHINIENPVVSTHYRYVKEKKAT